MDITEILELYASRITQIQLYQRAMQELSKKELVELQRFQELAKGDARIGEFPVAAHNMFFRSARDGELQFFGRSRSSITEQKRAVYLHKNKQYQWLLAEAYEEFEDYLERVYAWAGYKDHDFWPLRDFGNASLSELATHDFSWFRERAKQKKDVPGSILNILRRKFPDLERLESTNELDVNLRLAVSLVEMLRHIIVHKAGTTDNAAGFKEVVLKKAGLYNNGNYEQKYSDFVENFFGVGEFSNTVMLLEIPGEHGSGLNIHHNVFEILSNYLMAHAHLVWETLSNREPPSDGTHGTQLGKSVT